MPQNGTKQMPSLVLFVDNSHKCLEMTNMGDPIKKIGPSPHFWWFYG